MNPFARTWPLVLALVTTACRNPPSETADSATNPGMQTIEADTLARLQALGPGPAFVLTFYPGTEGWPRVRERLVAVNHRAATVLGEPGVDNPVLAIMRGVGIPVADVVLDGWNHERATLVATHDVILDGAAEAILVATIDHPERVRIRHHFLLPASDPDRLAAAIDIALAPVGRPYPELVDGLPDAVSARVVDGQGVVAVFRAAHEVRVVAITNAVDRDPIASRAAFAEDLRIDARAAERTPALELAASNAHGATAYARHGRVRALDSVQGVESVHIAVRGLAPDQRGHARVHGAALLVRCLRATGETRELEDSAIALRVDGEALRSDFVASLTPTGRSRLVGAASSASRLATKSGPVFADAFLQLTLPARGSGQAERQSLDDCNSLASLYLLMASPVSALNIFADTWDDGDGMTTVAAELLRTRSKALQLVVRGGSTGPRVALAATYEGKQEHEVEAAERMLRAHEGVRTDVARRNDDIVLLVGLGGDPQTVFDLGASAPPQGGILDASMATNDMPAPIAALFPAFAAAGLGVRDGTLFGQVLWSPSPVAAVEPLAPITGAVQPSGEASIAGRTCVLDALAATERALGEITDLRRRSSRDDGERWAAATTSNACSGASNDTTAAITSMDHYVRIQASRELVAIGETRAALQLVADTCGASRAPEICAERDRVAALPSVELATLELDARCVAKTIPEVVGTPVLIGSGRIVIGGKAVDATPAALTSAFAAVAKDTPFAESSAVVLVDRDTSLGDVLPVLDAIMATGADFVTVGSHVPGAGYVSTLLQLIRSPSARKALPLQQRWQGFSADIGVHCEVAALRF